MPPTQYFWDAYALVERAEGNASYLPYADVPVFTHQMDVYEFVACVSRHHPETEVREALRLLAPNLVDAETEDLFAAARFRAERRVSYVDALGYVLARKHGMRFLTGDRAFQGVEGVEYVPR